MGFNLLNDLSGLNYIYFSNFTNRQQKLILRKQKAPSVKTKGLTAISGGNRVAIDGVDNYGKLRTNIDKTSG